MSLGSVYACGVDCVWSRDTHKTMVRKHTTTTAAAAAAAATIQVSIQPQSQVTHSGLSQR